MPRSRTNPQFNGDSLPETLAPWQIGYEHIATLGGLRGKARNVEPSPNAYWRVRGFRNYADYALTETFAAGLAQLRELGRLHRCAIMCAEAVWWRCHRRIITDYLLSEGERVMHILGTAHVDEASLTPGAIVCGDGKTKLPTSAHFHAACSLVINATSSFVGSTGADLHVIDEGSQFRHHLMAAGIVEKHARRHWRERF
jgi:hypothetical protein